VTEDTVDDPSRAGAFRKEKDQIVVERRGIVIHVPPAAHELPERLGLMCQFANDRSDDVFIHPAVRAIILHFWIGYDHPFVDGNGRTARALFYWSMLSQGYWLTEYLSISKILKGAPAQYARSFLLTETDENDLTYFLEYQLEVVSRAIAHLHEYLRTKMAEVRLVEALLRQSGDINHRQLALLSHALKHPGYRYSMESHKRSHNVVYQTARTDLLDLVRRGLLTQAKRGRGYQFSAPDNLSAKLQRARSG
jgi:Fic family protein